jgi:Nucleotidyltransferase domain
MHIYIFGSLVRGEIEPDSDVDLLAILDSEQSTISIQTLWGEGSPFAWHLFTESRLVFAQDGRDWISTLGQPAPYQSALADAERFYEVFLDTTEALRGDCTSPIFELGTAYLALRNFAISYSLSLGDSPVFSRYAPFRLGEASLALDATSRKVLQLSRALSGRGQGERPSKADVLHTVSKLDEAQAWMELRLKEMRTR